MFNLAFDQHTSYHLATTLKPVMLNSVRFNADESMNSKTAMLHEQTHEKDDSSVGVGISGGKSTIFGASFNFVNSIVGAGIIGLPLAVQQSGLLLGILMLGLVAFLVNRSVIMLIECGIKVKKYDLEDLSEHILGKRGYYIALILMFLFAYGAQVAYLVIIGDSVPRVFQLYFPGSFLADRQSALGFIATLIVLPLCLFRQLSTLSWTSLLSILADVVILLIVLFTCTQAARSQQEHFQAADTRDVNSSVFEGVGTMSFAFVCQHNSFIVFRTLQRPSAGAWRSVAHMSVFSAFLISLIFGLTGFFAFYPYVQGDLLNNYPVSSNAVAMARLFLALAMIFTFPMELFVTRHCLISVLRKYTESWWQEDEDGYSTSPFGTSSSSSCTSNEHTSNSSSGNNPNTNTQRRQRKRHKRKGGNRRSSRYKDHSSTTNGEAEAAKKAGASYGDGEEEEVEEEEEMPDEDFDAERILVLCNVSVDETGASQTSLSFTAYNRLPGAVVDAAPEIRKKQQSSSIGTIEDWKQQQKNRLQNPLHNNNSNISHNENNNIHNSVTSTNDKKNAGEQAGVVVTTGSYSEGIIGSTGGGEFETIDFDNSHHANAAADPGINSSGPSMKAAGTVSVEMTNENQVHEERSNHKEKEVAVEEEDEEQNLSSLAAALSSTNTQEQVIDRESSDDDDNENEQDDDDDNGEEEEEGSNAHIFWHVLLSILLWGSSLAIALATSELGVVSSFTGALAASLLGYVLPAVLYLKANEEDFLFALDTFRHEFCQDLGCCKTAGGGGGGIELMSSSSHQFNMGRFHDADEELATIHFGHDFHTGVPPSNTAASGISTNPLHTRFNNNNANNINDHNHNGSGSNPSTGDDSSSSSLVCKGKYARIICEIWRRFMILEPYYTPMFMIVFGFASLIIGMVTIFSPSL